MRIAFPRRGCGDALVGQRRVEAIEVRVGAFPGKREAISRTDRRRIMAYSPNSTRSGTAVPLDGDMPETAVTGPDAVEQDWPAVAARSAPWRRQRRCGRRPRRVGGGSGWLRSPAVTHGIEGGWGGSPSWAPDGHTIAFDESDPPDAHSHIWTVDAEGGAIRQITNGANDQMAPTWSGDGRWIYFSARQGHGLDIWRIPVAGGAPQQVTRGAAGTWESSPSTGPVSCTSRSPRRIQPCCCNPCPRVSRAQLLVVSDSMPLPLRDE